MLDPGPGTCFLHTGSPFLPCKAYLLPPLQHPHAPSIPHPPIFMSPAGANLPHLGWIQPREASTHPCAGLLCSFDDTNMLYGRFVTPQGWLKSYAGQNIVWIAPSDLQHLLIIIAQS